MLSVHEQKISDGWVLYYNEDGYPYYYNESTGESEWAEYEEYGEEQNGYEEVRHRQYGQHSPHHVPDSLCHY